MTINEKLREYDNYRLKKGLDDACLDGYVKLINYCIFTEQDVVKGLEIAKDVKGYIDDFCKERGGTIWGYELLQIKKKTPISLVQFYYEILKMESWWNFESYMYYLEKDRDPSKRFYLPRQKVLCVVAHDIEDLVTRKIKFLGISLPSRVGKSTIALFGLTWLMLKLPNSHSAMGGHSGLLAKGFYKEVMNILSTPEYRFGELYQFWNLGHEFIRDKSAEDLTITLDQPDRFATLTCRGIDGTWTGAVDVSYQRVLVVDDLVRDREHSLSPTRMENTFQEYLNKMVDRKSGFDPQDGTFAGACELMIGTLWNVNDPLMKLESMYGDNPLYRFRKIPALDENDESNFPYQYSTEYLLDMRDKLDKAEWMAKWQQQPFVREGILFEKEEMNYFDGFILDELYKTIAVLDPAVGGGDSLSMPIIRDCSRKYVIDWVFNDGTQKVTVPIIVDKIMFHGITELYIEKNGVGRLFEDEIKREMEHRNCHHCRIITYSAPTGMSKEDKIRGYSDWVKDKLWFIETGLTACEGRFIRSSDYEKAMTEVHIYTSVGKNPHDDAPDSLAQVARVFEKQSNGTVDVIKNPFMR